MIYINFNTKQFFSFPGRLTIDGWDKIDVVNVNETFAEMQFSNSGFERIRIGYVIDYIMHSDSLFLGKEFIQILKHKDNCERGIITFTLELEQKKIGFWAIKLFQRWFFDNFYAFEFATGISIKQIYETDAKGIQISFIDQNKGYQEFFISIG